MERASCLLSDSERQLTQLIKSLEDEREGLAVEKDRAEALSADLVRRVDAAEAAAAAAEEAGKKAVREAAAVYGSAVAEKEAALERLLAEIVAEPTATVVGTSLESIRAVKAAVADDATGISAVELNPIPRDTPLAVGLRAVVIKRGPFFGRECVVASVTARGDAGEVSIGAATLRVKRAQLALPPADGGGDVAAALARASGVGKPRGPGAAKKRVGAPTGPRDVSKRVAQMLADPDAQRPNVSTGKYTAASSSSAQQKPRRSKTAGPALMTKDNTVDMRGMQLDEAREACRDLFSAVLAADRSPTAYLMHGHGTGALKRGLRDWLRKEPAVGTFKKADQSDGGDGVTVVVLKV